MVKKLLMKVNILMLYFLDLAKAFDTVDHSILCTKLNYYGFRGSSFDLLCSYLSDRQQRVLFHGELSEWGVVFYWCTPEIHSGSPCSLLYILMIYLQ